MTSPAIHLIGTAVADPELRFTPSGKAACTVRVVASDRKKQPDGTWADVGTTFLDVTAWDALAQNIADSVAKGDRVVVVGRLKQRSYETKAGEKRTVFEVSADDVGVALSRYAAKIVRSVRAGAGAADTVDAWSEPGF